MKKYLNKSWVILTVFFVPYLVRAEIYVCKGPDCGFDDLMKLVKSVLDYILMMTVPLSAIMFVYVGFLYMTSQGSLDKRKKANQIFTNVGIGLFFVLASWLIVKAILFGLGTKAPFIYLDF